MFCCILIKIVISKKFLNIIFLKRLKKINRNYYRQYRLDKHRRIVYLFHKLNCLKFVKNKLFKNHGNNHLDFKWQLFHKFIKMKLWKNNFKECLKNCKSVALPKKYFKLTCLKCIYGRNNLKVNAVNEY